MDRETDVLVLRPRRLSEDAGERLEAGALAGSWRIESPIATGGCGTVYAARHHVLARPAAVKVLHAELARSPEMIDRFVREARAVNEIGHPNIVDIFDFGTLADGRPFHVMELLAPGDLEQRVASVGRLAIVEVVAIMTPICHALDAAHRAGYIHRDLKARNIGFAAGAEGAEIPKLLDFGIAKLLEDEHGATGTIRAGTPHCMSPEQIRGERVDARTDVYALGVLLYHLATGAYPFDAPDAAEIERMHLETPPPAPSRLVPLPAALDELVVRALAKDPTARPASVLEFLGLLTAATSGAPANRCDAIAIRVELEVPELFDDDDLAEAAEATDRAVTTLGEAGFTPVLVTPTSVLAARVVRDDPAAERARAAELTTTLAGSLRVRRVTPRIAMHAAPADVVETTGVFVGGPLLDVHTWPPR